MRMVSAALTVLPVSMTARKASIWRGFSGIRNV
jgi:hypothetical protein